MATHNSTEREPPAALSCTPDGKRGLLVKLSDSWTVETPGAFLTDGLAGLGLSAQTTKGSASTPPASNAGTAGY